MKEMQKRINKRLLTGWAIIASVLAAVYFIEVIRGVRTIPYYLLFLCLTAAPLLISWRIYRKDRESEKIKYVVTAGFLIMYIFVMLTGKTNLVFGYIFPMISLLVLYHDTKLILSTGIISFGINVIRLAGQYMRGGLQASDLGNGLIQLGMIALVFGFSYVASKLYDEVIHQNAEFNEEIQNQSKQIQEMAMQTITTIANTIDAKDAYTEGHSARVAQYSRLLAKKLGKSDREADEIYNAALLHDIGKIGVPDSILNKPGKLTDEEFAMIRQHPAIGGKILQDFTSLPQLSVGAKYHHERYDGHGYPEGLKGEQIPETARIICVADSFDAMHSNRVYRRQFTREYIRSELEHCMGTQFDPKAAKAMLELMDEGQLAGIDTRPEKALKPGQIGEGYRGVERRSGEPLEMTKGLEDLSHRIRDIYASEEHDLLDTLGEAQAIQKFESNAAAKLVKNDGCLIILDIDNFSRLNHRFGFLCGDACLHLIAETLVGFRNLMVCRYEGDSFLAYADQIQSEEEAVEMIRELREELKKSLGTLETLSGVTISCGLSLSVISGRKFAKLLHCSEMALAIVKKENKGSYEIYHEREDEEILASAKDLDNLSSMIEREYSYKGAFDLEYAEFGRVYELIRNLGNRNAQTVQLVLFTILFNDNADMPISDRTMVMKYLESAINNTVRKVDVTARFSSTQRIVLFTNLKDKDKDMVIGRVVKEFYRMISDNTFRLVYVSKNINLQELRSR